MITTKNKFGLLDSLDDKPSVVDDDGNRYWHTNGKLVRNNGLPAIEMVNGNKFFYKEDKDNGNIYLYRKIIDNRDTYYNDDGNPHRGDGPAISDYFDNGLLNLEVYIKNNLFHREGGPAYRTYHPNGKMHKVIYYYDDFPHREDGPASLDFYYDGTLKKECYYIHGRKLKKEYFDSLCNSNKKKETIEINKKPFTLMGFFKFK
jgi:hypothetical protein